MKVLFRNKTVYDKENCDNFINFHAYKYGEREAVKYIATLLGVIFIIICNIWYKNWYLAIAIFSVAAIKYLIDNIKGNNPQKQTKKVDIYTFYFYERYIKIRYKRKFERILYLNIKKAFETDNNFFLYTDANSSLILDKDGFEIGTAKDFSEFIKRKCPLRYSNQKEK